MSKNKNMALFTFLDAWNDDELSDGAWFAMLEEGSGHGASSAMSAVIRMKR